MRRCILPCSLCLNALLVLTLGWQVWSPVARRPAGSVRSGAPNDTRAGGLHTGTSAGAGGAETLAPVVALVWSQLDRSTLFMYRDSLRAAGCPGRTTREILEPLVDRDFYARVRTLIARYVEQFWELFRPPSEDRLKDVEKSLDALKEEHDRLIEVLFARLPSGGDGTPGLAQAEMLFSFLPPGVRERALDAWENSEARKQDFLRAFHGSPQEHVAGLSSLNAELETELAAFLSPEELAQFRLRNSPAAELRGLEGVNLTTDELATLIELKDRIAAEAGATDAAAKAARERAEVEKVLGPEKAAELARAQNGEFQALVRIADRLGATVEQAVQLWDVRQQVAASAAEVAKRSGLPRDEQRALLEALRKQLTDQAGRMLGGERGVSTWERVERGWLDRTFTPPPEDPLAKPPAP